MLRPFPNYGQTQEGSLSPEERAALLAYLRKL